MSPSRLISDEDPGCSASAGLGNLLLAEFTHRAANDFAVACAEVQAALRLPTLAAVRDRLEITVGRLHALASIQRILQPGRQEAINIGDVLCDLCRCQAEARFAQQGAFIRLRTCEATVDATTGTALLMIVSELLTNAARHALDGPGGSVEIDVTLVGERLRCRVRDNGVGIGARERATAQGGTMLVGELARNAGMDFTMPLCATGVQFEISAACWSS